MAPTRPSPDSKNPHRDIFSAITTGIKKSTAHPRRPKVDLDKCCGVADVGTGSPCPKPFRDCQTHSRAQKRVVAGRSCSYDMLMTAPAWNRGPRSYKSPVDNGEGSSKGTTKAEKRGVEKHFYIRESVPRVEIPYSKKGGKGKDKTNREDSKEKALGSDAPARPKGKKPGPKAWTALESEVAKDIGECAGHKISTIELLEVARKIIEKVRGNEGGDTEEHSGGFYRVVGWGA